MEKISKLINEAHYVIMSSMKCCFIEDKGYVLEDSLPLYQSRLYEKELAFIITIRKDRKFKILYNEAQLSLALLSRQQLANALKNNTILQL